MVFKGYCRSIIILLMFLCMGQLSAQEKKSPLLNAFLEGDIKEAKSLISKITDVKKASENAEIIMAAALSLNEEIIKLLLEKGFDPNSENSLGESPLSHALIAVNLNLKNTSLNELFKLINKGKGLTSLKAIFIKKPDADSLKKCRRIVKMLLDHKADINKPNSIGLTSFQLAIQINDEDLLDLMMKYKPNVNVKGNSGESPLSIAVNNGNLKFAKQLLDLKADVNAKDKLQLTPLQSAAMKGHTEIADLLLKYDVDIDAKDNAGFTALHTAVEYGQTDLATLLIDKGADIKTVSSSGTEILSSAAVGGSTSIVKSLLKADYSVAAKSNALRNAALWVRPEIVKLLLDHGADVNAIGESNNGTTALHNITMVSYVKEKKNIKVPVPGNHQKRIEILKLLLAAGAKVNIANKGKNMPLHLMAGEWGSVDAVKLLLDAGAKINSPGFRGMLPVAFAAKNGYPKLVSFMLKNGALSHIHAKDIDGIPSAAIAVLKGQLECLKVFAEHDRTVLDFKDKENALPFLHIAASRGNGKMVRFLLDQKADPNAKSNDGQTALHQVSMATTVEEQMKMEFSLRKINKISLEALIELNRKSFGKDHAAIAEMLIRAGAKLNPMTRNGTPLHFCAFKGNAAVAKVLLANGADMRIREPEFGCFPIHNAADWGRVEVVKLLLEKGIDANVKDRNGTTVLHYAAKRFFSKPQQAYEIAKLAIKHGADINIKWAQTGFTPLHVAIETNNVPVAGILIDSGAAITELNLRHGSPLQRAKQLNRKAIVAMMTAKVNGIPGAKLYDEYGNKENLVAIVLGDKVLVKDVIALSGGYDNLYKDIPINLLYDSTTLPDQLKLVHNKMDTVAKGIVKMRLLFALYKKRAIAHAQAQVNPLERHSNEDAVLRKLGINPRSLRDFSGKLNPQALNKALQLHDWSEDDLLKYSSLLAVTKYAEGLAVKNCAPVKDYEVKEYYDANKGTFLSEENIRIEMIAVKSEDSIKNILKQYQNGKGFAELAREYSILSSAKNGGDTGWRKTSEMSSFVKDSFKEFKLGNLSSPTMNAGLFFLFRLKGIQPKSERKLKDVSKQIREKLFQKRVQEYTNVAIEFMFKEDVQLFLKKK